MIKFILGLPDKPWWRPLVVFGFACGLGLLVSSTPGTSWFYLWLVQSCFLAGRITAWMLGVLGKEAPPLLDLDALTTALWHTPKDDDLEAYAVAVRTEYEDALSSQAKT